MTCWNVLELDRQSDERTLKRQYAALLKVTRPDDDPTAFQRLREAYEEALQQVRHRIARDEPDESDSTWYEPAQPLHGPATAPVGAHSPAPVADDVLLQELFAQLEPSTLDACLSIARERGCERAFEQRLLAVCLSAHPHAEPIAEWALVSFDWLRPWQPTPLPAAQMQALASRLLQWKLPRLERLLAEGQEDAAQAHVEVLLSSAWLQSLDRREWLQRSLLAWLATNGDWSLAFFQAFCTRIGVEPDDYKIQQSPVWQGLMHRYGGQRVLLGLREQLARKKPGFLEDQAAWLLFKPLGAGRRRRLIDQMGAQAWEACVHLEEVVRRYPQLLGALGMERLPDWRQWQPRAVDATRRWWLLLGCFVTVQGLDVWNMVGTDTAFAFTPAVMAGNLFMASIMLMMFYGSQIAWQAGALRLGIVDGWLSRWLLPRRVTREGSGFLLLRHLVPCLMVGATGGLWIHETLGYGWVYGVLCACLMALYQLTGLGLLGAENAQPGARTVKWKKIGNILGVIAVVFFTAAYLDENRECDKVPRGQLAACLKFGPPPPEVPEWLRATPVKSPAKNSFNVGETLTPESQLLPEETLPSFTPAREIELKYK